MFIKRKIDEFFRESKARFHDLSGKEISPEQTSAEFHSIRNYFEEKIPPGEIVAVSMPHDYRFLVCFYAALSAGRIYLPLHPQWPEARIAQIRSLTKFKTLITESAYEEIKSRREKGRNAALKRESPAYVICTSGSTGAPKGVVVSRGALENFFKSIDADFAEFDSEQRVLSTADYTFDAAYIDPILFVLKKCRLFFSSFGGNFFRLAKEIEDYGITSINTVPNNMSMLLSDVVFSRANLSLVKYLFLGGSRFSASLYSNIEVKMRPKPVTVNYYGPTESTIYSHLKKMSWDEERDRFGDNISIGKPVKGVTCRIVDNEMREVTEPGKTGELLLGGAQLMTGYVGDPKKTAESWAKAGGETYYKTGDLSFMNEDGEYFIVGRTDDTLKHRGFRVNLLDIDSYIQKIEGVQVCATVAIPDEKTDNYLVCFVVPSSGQITEEELRAAMARQLVDYQIPDEIRFISQFPASTSGKVSKTALKEIYLGAKTKKSPP